jgi:hypothetical protein
LGIVSVKYSGAITKLAKTSAWKAMDPTAAYGFRFAPGSISRNKESSIPSWLEGTESCLSSFSGRAAIRE